MKKISATLMVLLIGMGLVSIPADIFTSANPGESYPLQPTDDVIIEALGYLQSRQAIDGSIGGFSISSWAAMAISAAGEDPRGSLIEYLRDNADRIDDTKATDWEGRHLPLQHVTKIQEISAG